jgi:starch synthase
VTVLKRILMVAAENGALPGGKVGGIGDVIVGLPLALSELGWEVTVITPAYGMFSQLPGAERLLELSVPFAGAMEPVALFRVPGPDSRVTHLVMESPLFSPQGPGKIYCHDESHLPFATDAGKFALLCAAVAVYLEQLDALPQVVHLHDWHAALYLALREFDPAHSRLRQVTTVYTIHNLALQGIRPLRHAPSSLESWFPGLRYDYERVGDPRYDDCVNPMATGIRLADRVNTVSPAYAREILEPDNPELGFHGGEGLQKDLQRAEAESRLVGILNGVDYSKRLPMPPRWVGLIDAISEQAQRWNQTGSLAVDELDALAEKLLRLRRGRPANVLTSIGRMTSQKAELFLQPTSDGRTALDAILDELGNRSLFIMLGSGERDLEQHIAHCARDRSNFVYLCGYSENLSHMLYATGDMFLMPSSFEPCGISQMLAMRSGQPCVVHAVGGLRDTVEHDVTGFVFDGSSRVEKADDFVGCVNRALALKRADPRRWAGIRTRAAAQRYTWARAAAQYQEEVYGYPGG